MDDKTLAEVVRQLDGEPCEDTGPRPAASAPEAGAPSFREELFEGLRATEWMLSDLRERCRQLHGYRLRLIDQLQQLDGDGEAETVDEWANAVVPGPLALQ